MRASSESADVLPDDPREDFPPTRPDGALALARGAPQARAPGSKFRWFDPRHEARFEPRDEAVVEGRDRFRGAVAREHDLLIRAVEFVEGVEQLFVDLRHPAEELDIVDEEAVHPAHPLSERPQRALLAGLGQTRPERFTGQVEDLRTGLVRCDIIPDRMEEMRLPEAGTRRDQERVVGLRGLLRDRDRGRVGEPGALADREAFELESHGDVRGGVPRRGRPLRWV